MKRRHHRYYVIEPGFSPIVERVKVFRTHESRERYLSRRRKTIAALDSPSVAAFWFMNVERVDGWGSFLAYRFRNGGYALILAFVILFACAWIFW